MLGRDDLMDSLPGIGLDPTPFIRMSGSLCLAVVRMSNGYAGSCLVMNEYHGDGGPRHPDNMAVKMICSGVKGFALTAHES